MKLATRRSGTRDGELCIVSRDLQWAVSAKDIAPTLQHAVDHWNECAPALLDKSTALNAGQIKDVFAFKAADMMAPLPRAYQWLDGSAYVNHVELVRKARGADMPLSFWTDPLMYQGASDDLLGPCDPIVGLDPAWGIDFEAEVTVVTTDVPLNATPQEAEKHIILLMLVNDISLRHLIPAELQKGFGFLQSKPASTFSPVAITPDELDDAWQDGKVHLPLRVHYNQSVFGTPNAGVDMTFNFPSLVSHAAKTRRLKAGTIVGSGTVSNLDRSQGSCCIAEKRCLETIETGKAVTAFMQPGDSVKIEMLDKQGQSIFGAIDQKVQGH